MSVISQQLACKAERALKSIIGLSIPFTTFISTIRGRANAQSAGFVIFSCGTNVALTHFGETSGPPFHIRLPSFVIEK